MYKRAVSGQYLYFGLVSALSGIAVTGQAAGISGRKSVDASGQALLSGPISEIGGGQYAAGLYDWDVSGNNIGYLFTASGCIPVSFSVVTIDTTSGRLFLGSGSSVNLLSGNITSPYSGSLSGQLVGILSGQLSGQVVNLLSGNQVGLWSGTNVNLFSGSQVNVWSGQLSGQVVTSTVQSGQVWLASGYPADILKYNYSGITGEADRSLLNATRKLINEWSLSTHSGKITVFKEDDTTEAYQQNVTATIGASPITKMGG